MELDSSTPFSGQYNDVLPQLYPNFNSEINERSTIFPVTSTPSAPSFGVNGIELNDHQAYNLAQDLKKFATNMSQDYAPANYSYFVEGLKVLGKALEIFVAINNSSRTTVIDNSTNVNIGNTVNNINSNNNINVEQKEKTKNRREKNDAAMRAVSGVVGAGGLVFLADRLGKDYSIWSQSSKAARFVQDLKTEIESQNFGVLKRTYDKITTNSNRLISDVQRDVMFRTALKVTMAVGSSLLLIGAVANAPQLIVGGAVLSFVATLVMIASRHSSSAKDIKELADKILEDLGTLPIPTSNSDEGANTYSPTFHEN
ncbi:MAG: hypothetical protein Tsb0021_06230 [Chlamydiales bacterium]